MTVWIIVNTAWNTIENVCISPSLAQIERDRIAVRDNLKQQYYEIMEREVLGSEEEE